VFLVGIQKGTVCEPLIICGLHAHKNGIIDMPHLNESAWNPFRDIEGDDLIIPLIAF
jgi:hypothetical protein